MRSLCAALLMVSLAGCVDSEKTLCGDQVCPVGRACAPSGPPTCVDEDLVQACAGREEEQDCTVAGGRPGVCTGGLCLLGACGDGRINGDNQCDGPDLGGMDCEDFGSAEPEGLVCVDCRFDPSGCRSRCGDGIVNGIEDCDGADLAGKTCTDFGFYAPDALVCNEAGTDRECTFNVSGCSGGRCGDGILDDLEPCDGELLAGTCASEGFFGPVTALRCTPNCSYEASSCLCGGFHCARDTEQCVDVGEGRLVCQPCPKTGC